MSGESNAASLVVVAHAVKVKGLKGEVVAVLLTDFPDRFENIDQFFAISPEGEQISVVLERFSFQADRVVLKLAGYDSVDAARTLVGYDFAVPESDRVELEDDEFYDWELEGCEVKTTTQQLVGVVTGVMRTGGVNLLVVTAGEESRLIPMVSSILVSIDKESKLVIIDPPEGLLEL
ncbi:MAG TPA: ribosome maturation factor RimM [Pyrinomonadaceae bacterium]|nr:ribosome maturation factor RimM [Pyrinomonadaceae bacterium]